MGLSIGATLPSDTGRRRKSLVGPTLLQPSGTGNSQQASRIDAAHHTKPQVGSKRTFPHYTRTSVKFQSFQRRSARTKLTVCGPPPYPVITTLAMGFATDACLAVLMTPISLRRPLAQILAPLSATHRPTAHPGRSASLDSHLSPRRHPRRVGLRAPARRAPVRYQPPRSPPMAYLAARTRRLSRRSALSPLRQTSRSRQQPHP